MQDSSEANQRPRTDQGVAKIRSFKKRIFDLVFQHRMAKKGNKIVYIVRGVILLQI
jgi:hypothetical protein